VSVPELYIAFFKIGLFTIGGGLAALPLLQDTAIQNGWFSLEEFFHMVAVSESTPGPIGVNMATYVGYETAGIPGALGATLGLVSPSVIIIVLVARFFLHFNEKPLVRSAFSGLRPAVTGLIATAAFKVLMVAVIPWEAFRTSGRAADLFDPFRLGIFALLLWSFWKFKKHPIIYIIAGAVLGILFL